MNTPNPLIPQGSLEAQQYKKRSATKIAVSIILSIHGVVLGGLLFLGCKEEPGAKEAANPPATNQFGEVDRTTSTSGPFGDLPLDTNDIQIPKVAFDTNHPFGAPNANPDSGFTAAGGTTTLPPNPALLTNNQGPGGFPPTSAEENTATPGSQLVNEPVSTAPTKYTVLPNDNFWTIASKHNISVKDVVAANPNVDPRKLKVGQEINLPANVKPKTPTLPDVGPGTAAASEKIYVVKSGDTLYDLARRFHVKVKDLQRANGIVGSVIRVGQKLIIPGGAKSGTNQ